MPNNPYIAGGGSDDQQVSRFPEWRELLVIVAERAWLGASVFAAVFFIFVIGLLTQTPYYQSRAVLLVEAQIPRLLNYQDVVAFNSRNLEYFNTIISTLHSQKIMEQALTETGLVDNRKFLPGVEGLAARAGASRGLVSITPVEKSRLINIIVEHPDPEMASQLANGVANAYIQADLDDRMQASMQAVDWLRERSDEYRAKLEAGLLELQQYRESTESVSLEEDQNIVIAKLKALNNTLTQAQTDRIDVETQWQAIKSQIDQGVPMVRIASQLGDQAVSDALQQWQAQQREVAALQQRYKPGYPELKQALDLAGQLEMKFKEACENAVLALQGRYEMLTDRENNLREALRRQEQEAFELDRKLVRYNDLKRNVEADQEIYQSVIARMKEASISGTLPSEIIRIAEVARPGSRPVRPQPARSLSRGLAFGLVAGLGVIFVLYYADHRFRRNEEVERALEVPVLSTLPLIEGKDVRERGMIMHLDPHGEVAEAFRTLRAGMMMRPEVRDARVMLVSSSQPGEGKSLVSANLAISFAQDGRKTLLVGADLRRPSLEKIFADKKVKLGLSDVLNGRCAWSEALMKMPVTNLDVLPSGSTPANPADLLGGASLRQVFEEARKTYDYIIIDAPPLLGVSDSLVLQSYADGVLFVVRYGITHSLGAGHAMKKIREGGTRCLGAIMNGVNLKSLANYYYYRRYGGYAYQQYKTAPPEPAVKT